MENTTYKKLDYSIHSDALFIKNCPKCKKIFVNQGDFEKHMNKAHPQKPYECTQCGAGFTLRNRYEKHMLDHKYKRVVTFPCTYCEKSFSKKKGLDRHLWVHTEEKPFRCHLCDRGFLQESFLADHMANHMGEPRYKCSLCGKCFPYQSSRDQHIMTHTGVKPHKCPKCDKAFARKSHLKTHILTHTGERPYECIHCGLTFTQKPHLNKHIKRTHNSQEEFDVNLSEAGVLKISKKKKKSKMGRPRKYSTEYADENINEAEKDRAIDDSLFIEDDNLSNEEIMLRIEEDIEERRTSTFEDLETYMFSTYQI